PFLQCDWWCRRHVTRRRPGEELASHNYDQGKQDSQADEASRQTVRGDQILRQWRNIDSCSAVTPTDQSDHEAALGAAEPTHRRWSCRGVPQAHADAAQYAEADDQAGVTLQQSGENAAASKRKAAQCCA